MTIQGLKTQSKLLSEMEAGVEPQNSKKTMSITDRKQAIKTACQLAQSNDIILDCWERARNLSRG